MLNILYSFYFKCSKKKFLGQNDFWGRFLALLFRKIAPFYYNVTSIFCASGLAKNKNQVPFIVSLTTFPSRIDKVWLVIETILRQKQKPDKIILWLYKGEFNEKKSLPSRLLGLEKRGLEIRFCDENLMPHKKYYYTMLEYPEANVVTVDDDMFYPPDLLFKLMKFHKQYPAAIVCPVTRKIEIENIKMEHYQNWKYTSKNSLPSFTNLMIGVGGVFYPSNSLYPDVLDLEKLKRFALKADDLWLKIMSLKNNTKVVSLAGEYNRFYIPVLHDNDKRLMDFNIGEGQNDLIFNQLMEYYQIPLTIFEN